MTLYRDCPLGDLPVYRYNTVYADPPWAYLTWSAKGRGKSPKYGTLSLDDIKALPVAVRCTADAVLVMWVIDTHLEMAFEVVEAWGFKFKTVCFTWAKTSADGSKFPIGTGFWTRANPEMALLATVGHPKRQDKGVPRLIIAPRREHSRKPDEAYERIERLVPGPYLEMFSRNDRPGWDCWGWEAGLYRRRTIEQDVEDVI